MFGSESIQAQFEFRSTASQLWSKWVRGGQRRDLVRHGSGLGSYLGLVSSIGQRQSNSQLWSNVQSQSTMVNCSTRVRPGQRSKKPVNSGPGNIYTQQVISIRKIGF
ncbi:hypothetical protein Hdeb2414_s0009g00317021 [Helianthus debilis subsp. tardiflorus]